MFLKTSPLKKLIVKLYRNKKKSNKIAEKSGKSLIYGKTLILGFETMRA